MKARALLITIPLMGILVANGWWAEPDPSRETAFQVSINHKAAGEPEITLEVETLEEKEDGFDKAIDLMARCIEAEAGNQSSLGKRLVADVILNRVQSEAFPDSIEGVITQPGQFGVVANGSINEVTSSEETMQAVLTEMNGRIDEEIIYFQAGRFSQFGEPAYQVDKHYFSK